MSTINYQTSRLDYYYRHARTTLPHLTLRKVANLALNFLELRIKAMRPRSFPPYMKVEPTPLCHLSCLGCPQREPAYKEQFDPSMRMGLEDFKRAIDPFADYLLGISLSLRGEPLLNRNLPSLVKYANSKNIATSFPTNLSVPMDERFAEEIVGSGLDAMYISLDGATRESYERYRVGGNFDLVVKNVRLLEQAKHKLKSKTPRLIWKFVIFEYNQNEIADVHRIHRQLGFDEAEFVQDYGSETAKEKERSFNRRLVETKTGCFFLWNAMVVIADGAVKPCCMSPQDFALGNTSDGLKEVWRSEAYRQLRAGFASKNFGKNMHPVCKSCVGLAPRPTRIPVQITANQKLTANQKTTS
jgi:radical SAM protein with 4Fe4S-binding SPASM domain